MEGRWYIFRDEEPLGPWTAAEIRERLRDGLLDPFEPTAKEGSSEQVPLVQVDEIFLLEEEDSDLIPGDELFASTLDIPPQNEQASAKKIDELKQKLEDPKSLEVSKNRDLDLGEAPKINLQSQVIPKPKRNLSSQQKRRNIQPRIEGKNYYVIDGNERSFGPISAKEIIALYYKRAIAKNVLISKNGIGPQVSLEKFVSVYARAKKAALDPSRKYSKGYGPKEQKYSSAKFSARQMLAEATLVQKRLMLMIYVLLGIVLGMLLLFVTSSLTPQFMGYFRLKPNVRVEKKSAFRKKTPQELQKLRTNRSDGRGVDRSEIPERLTNSDIRMRTHRISMQDESRRLRESSENSLNIRDKPSFYLESRKQQPKKKLEVERAPKKKRRKTELVILQREQKGSVEPVSRPLAPPKSPMTALRQPPSQAQKQSSPPPLTKAEQVFTDRQQVFRLGPMRFNPQELASCNAACLISFEGPQKVKAKFFKAVWEQKLQQKNGNIYLSGLVRKNGDETTIILSNVD